MRPARIYCFLLIFLAICAGLVVYTKLEGLEVTNAVLVSAHPDFSKDEAYLQTVPIDCARLDVADEYTCLSDHASSTLDQINVLEKQFASLPVEQIKRDVSNRSGTLADNLDFGLDLSVDVRDLSYGRDDFLDTLCSMEALKVYGGSSEELEALACKNYYLNQYLQMLMGIQQRL